MVKTNLPVMLIRGMVALPNNEIRIEINNKQESDIINLSILYHEGHLLLVTLKDYLEETPSLLDLPKIAQIGKIKSRIELPNGTIRLVLHVSSRVEVLNYLENDHKNIEAFVIPTEEADIDLFEANAIRRILYRDLNEYIENASNISNSVLGRISGINNIGVISDIIAFELPIAFEKKYKYIYEVNPIERSKMLLEDINQELSIINLENKIETELQKELNNTQKEFLLREKIKIIKEELGEKDLKESDIDSLKETIEKKKLTGKIKTRLNNELSRYELTPSNSPEVSVIRNYIDSLISIPFGKYTKDNDNIEDIKRILDKSHYGSDEVKEKIVETIAVNKITNKKQSEIICLVGPPGVGKTSLAKSIANALNKKFVKISVGGIHDEAEIMGHRRTYIGSAPGKIIQGLRKSNSMNPVFLIDEIDKMTKDYRGDPASALLDILDREQNYMFVDNYIEEEIDLSQVLFILTANNLSSIPDALRDRLEIIEINSYTIYEKIAIAKNYIIKSIAEELSLNNKIVFSDDIIKKIITDYTKEAGVRELTRLIEKIARKVLIENYLNKKNHLTEVTDLEKYLGIPKYNSIKNNKTLPVGVVNALAYTNYGGSILKVSATYYKGNGNIKITGNLGEVMKESVEIALSYIKSNYQTFKIDPSLFENDLHIHFEEGAIAKDGPSAGITITTALISLFTNHAISNNISMTGEITLRGDILPIGGLKEKLVSAFNDNITDVFIPIENHSDLEKIPLNIKNKLKIHEVTNYLEIYQKLMK